MWSVSADGQLGTGGAGSPAATSVAVANTERSIARGDLVAQEPSSSASLRVLVPGRRTFSNLLDFSAGPPAPG